MELKRLAGLYTSGPIPHNGLDMRKSGGDYSGEQPTVSSAGEQPRSEYSYVWNTDGLRSVDFSTKPEVVALGCSVTLGQGLPVWARWSDLLGQRIGRPVGNISYSGSSIDKNVSSFFGMVNKYNYVPKIVIANFAHPSRIYFVSGDGEWMRDVMMTQYRHKTEASMPWEYGEILPYEWVYRHELEHVKMLEVFCRHAGVRLLWSSWSVLLKSEDDEYLQDTFEYYVPDPDRHKFPPHFETGPSAETLDGVRERYAMIDWASARCHEEAARHHADIFDYAYDYHKNAGPWGPGAHWPHQGMHRHLHYTDFYYRELVDRNWLDVLR